VLPDLKHLPILDLIGEHDPAIAGQGAAWK
jgi:hypothetical protein